MSRFRNILSGAMAGLALGVVAGCGGIEPEDGEASLRVAIASASGCGYQHVRIAVDSVRVHQSPIAGEDALGWRTLKLDATRRIDLMAMDNGVLEDLGATRIPVGRYQQLRLVLAPNTATRPLLNSVTKPGEGELPLAMPPARQSGLLVRIDRDLDADEGLDLVLDFDACRSVVPDAGGGNYLLEPTLRLLPWPEGEGSSVLGRLGNLPADGAVVSLQQAGHVLRTTTTDATGRFLLSPAPSGTHDLVIRAEGRTNMLLAGVPVRSASRTTVVAQEQPITLVTSGMRSVSGRIGLLGGLAIPAARASALQGVGTHVIEAGSRPVDAADGGFSLRLPVQAPMLANYDAQADGHDFSPDIGQAGRYTIEAALPGRPVQTRAVEIRMGDAVANFDFAP